MNKYFNNSLEKVPPLPLSTLRIKGKAQMECSDIQSGQELIREKRVRFNDKGAPKGSVEPRCSEEDVELCVINWKIHKKNLYAIREEFLSFGAHIWTIQEGFQRIENLKKAQGYR